MSSLPSRPAEDPRSTADLLAAARASDPTALEALVERIRPQLENAATARVGRALGRELNAADLLQSTYFRVLRSLGDFRGGTEAELTAWSRKILERTLRDHLRYARAERRNKKRETASSVDKMPAGGHTPSAEMAAHEEVELIHQAMAELPANYRHVLTLHMDPEQTHARTAALLGKSEGASRILLARARAALLGELRRLRGELP